MGDKKITISVGATIDPSITKINKVMEEAAQRAQKLGKGVSEASGMGGFGAAAKGDLGKNLLKQQKAFESLGKYGEKLGKILRDNVLKGQVDLAKQFEESGRKLDPLLKKYERAEKALASFRRGGVDSSRIDLAERTRDRAYLEMAGVVSTLVSLQQRMAADQTPPGGQGAGGPGGGGLGIGGLGGLGGLLGSLGGGVVSGPMMRLLGPMGIGIGAAIGAFKLASKVGENIYGAPRMASAAEGQSLAAQQRATGDFGYLLGTQIDKAKGTRTQMDLSFTPMEMGEAQGVGARASQWAALKGLPGFAWNSLTQGSSEAKRILDIKTDAARREAELRVNAEHGQSRAAEVERISQYTLPVAYQMEQDRRRYGAGSWEQISRRAADMHIDRGMLAGAISGVSGHVGNWAAKKYGIAAAAMNASGMDIGVASDVIGRTAVGGANVFGAMGGFDPVIKGMLGQSVAGTMGANTMMYAGAGGNLAASLSAGMNATSGAAGVRQAQQLGLGMGLQGQMFAGHSPYQKSYNIAAATSALGPNASPYTVNFLATQLRDPKVLADISRGKLPPAFANMGVTPEQAKAMAKDVMGGFSGRWYDTGEQSKSAEAMRAVRGKFGGDPFAYLRTFKQGAERQKQVEMLAPMLSQTDELFGGDVGAAEGFLMAGTGLGGRGAQGRGKGGVGGTGTIGTSLEIENRALKQKQTLLDIDKTVNDGLEKEGVRLVDTVKQIADGIDDVRKKFGRNTAPSSDPFQEAQTGR